jgi:hypothetical protein
MDKTDLFIRTAKGDQEVATQANKLPIKHRSVLIMIDGKNSEETLQKKLSGMFDGKAILNDLESHGFIMRQAGAGASTLKALEPSLNALNSEAKKYMIDTIYQVLGPEGDSMVSRIEKCKNNKDLSGLIAMCRDTMSGLGKKKRAEEFEGKIKSMLV